MSDHAEDLLEDPYKFESYTIESVWKKECTLWKSYKKKTGKSYAEYAVITTNKLCIRFSTLHTVEVELDKSKGDGRVTIGYTTELPKLDWNKHMKDAGFREYIREEFNEDIKSIRFSQYGRRR